MKDRENPLIFCSIVMLGGLIIPTVVIVLFKINLPVDDAQNVYIYTLVASFVVAIAINIYNKYSSKKRAEKRADIKPVNKWKY